MAKVQPAFPRFSDVDGSPLEDGFIYIGQEGLNPEVNPITVYSDKDLTIPLAQPLRTLGGFIVVSGTPVQAYTAENNYSITVRNKNSTLVRSSLTATGEVFIPSSLEFRSIADMQSGTSLDGTVLDYDVVFSGVPLGEPLPASTLYDVRANRDSGSFFALWRLGEYRTEISDGSWVPDGVNDFYIGVGNIYVAVYQNTFVKAYPKFVYVDSPPYSGDLSTALDDATEGTVLILGPNTYDILDKYIIDSSVPVYRGNETDNLTIRGSGMPEYNAASDGFVAGSGTIIQGALINFGDNFQCYNLGVDCGTAAVAANGGNYMNAFVPGTNKKDTVAGDLSTYIKGGSSANIRVAMAAPTGSSTTFKHGILIETIDGYSHGYLETRGGYHGYVVKSVNVQGTLVKVAFSTGTVYIFKSDQYTRCQNVHVDNIQIGQRGQARTLGEPLWESRDGEITKLVSIGCLQANNCFQAFEAAAATTNDITDIRVGHIQADDLTGTVVAINSFFKRVKFGTHEILNAPTGIHVLGGQEDVDIGSGNIWGATGTGAYLLQGDVRHGNIRSRNATGYGVVNNGYTADPARISGSNNASGDIDTLQVVGVTFEAANGWANSGFFPLEVYAFGGSIRLHGQANAAANNGTGTILTLPAGVRPARDLRFWLPTLRAGVWAIESVVFQTNGVVAFTDGSIVNATDVNFMGTEIFYTGRV